jgi:hypothetical protein
MGIQKEWQTGPEADISVLVISSSSGLLKNSWSKIPQFQGEF